NPERAVTYWDWSLIPVKDKYGVVDGLILTLLNVTKRILTEVSLRESETKYKGLFNGIRDSILVANTDRKIINYNPAFSSLFGYSLNDIIGKPTLYIYENEEQFIELGNAIKKHVADLTPFFYTVNYKKKNGDVFPGETGIYYLKDTDGEVFGFIGLIRDITEKLRIEKALKDSEAKYRNINTELEKTNNMKELLLDIMSHDLRNPAGAISGLTEMAIEENPEDEILQLIKSASDSLLQVIEKATILSKVALDEEIEKEELDLSKLIRQVINEFKTFLNSNGMSVEYQPLEALTIKANSIIGEVFRNYISNAIKYAHIGNRIVIEQEIMDDVVTVYVKDFGKTIPIEEYDNIFERRVQLSKVEKRGQGLGLAIVKRIAEAHKGEVGVKQNEPNGNIFYLKIPKG
ncbi:MAG: PAS domain-containing sensor histidine kinase, partial [Candidatus Marinimicrobia bacterium]|nr:PAS domain-containing sensor histidine kinase [Candidatus Neomarinimicrobiota bacterium]